MLWVLSSSYSEESSAWHLVQALCWPVMFVFMVLVIGASAFVLGCVALYEHYLRRKAAKNPAKSAELERFKSGEWHA